jgi:translation initiation factor 2 beta subunit (eIF-2beta)/eIF-5
MTTVMPEGEAIRKAIKWISAELHEDPGKPVIKLVNEAVARFDLSPKDSEFLISFYKKEKGSAMSN